MLVGDASWRGARPLAATYWKNPAFLWMKPCHLAGTFSCAKIADTGHTGTHASQSMHVAGSIYICC
jgi:hypothetical protein